jgi:hypothetical protein
MDIEQLSSLIREKTLKRENTTLLKWVLGECQLYGKDPVKVMEKLYADNNQTYSLTNKDEYLKENREIEQYLPKYLSMEEIASHIGQLGLDNSGKSIGIAMKHLKGLGLNVRSEDVRKVLQ